MGVQRQETDYYPYPSLAEMKPGSSYGAAAREVMFVPAPMQWSDWAALYLAFLVPSGIFVGTNWLLHSSLRYAHGELTWFVVCLSALVIVVGGFVAYSMTARQRSRQGLFKRPSWYLFLLVTASCALILAMILGEEIYSNGMLLFYELSSLDAYDAVDPTEVRPGQMLDAGTVGFTDTSTFVARMTAEFHNGDTYCVAPITAVWNNSLVPLALYEFWAVGINCCNASASDFRCYEQDSHAGLRMLNPALIPSFKLAVREAQVQYQIKSSHPIFVYLVSDPSASINGMQADSSRKFEKEVYVHMVCQFLAVLFVTLRYWRYDARQKWAEVQRPAIS